MSGDTSKTRYNELAVQLQNLVDQIHAKVCTISILVGHRTQVEQDLAYARGTSKVRWPLSKHNSKPSRAMDICPAPVNLKSQSLREELTFIAGAVRILALDMGLKVRWGGDWDKDGDLEDNTFDDLFHFELEE